MRVAANIVLFVSLIAFGKADEFPEISKIWIDGDNYYPSENTKISGTFYFEEWSELTEHYLHEDRLDVVIQLDKDFRIASHLHNSLIDLSILSRVSEQSKIKEYLVFFIGFSQAKGVTHYVLPDTALLNPYEKEVVNMAYEMAPNYFIYKNHLSREIPANKNEFLEERKSQKIYVTAINQELKKLERWSKWSKKLKGSRNIFATPITAWIGDSKDFSEAYITEIQQSIAKAAISYIGDKHLIPIKSKTITYLGSDQKLYNLLSRYTDVILYRQPNVPAIVDNRSMVFETNENDIVIDNVLGDYKNVLVIPSQLHEPYPFIADGLFGVAAVSGKMYDKPFQLLTKQEVIAYPEVSTFDPKWQNRIDSIMNAAISKYATPGGQVAIIKDNQVVFEKAYGYYTYDSLKQVEKNTMYDLASLTKVLATLPSIAILIQRGKLTLDDSIGQHMPIFKETKKAGITIRQLLAHHSGLKSYVPFWKMALDGDRLEAFYYRNEEDEKNDVRSYGYEPDPILIDTLKSYLVHSELIKDRDQYHYSDLGFMILHLIVEEVSGQSFASFVKENIIDPLHLHHLSFNPVKQGFTYEDIAPTELDMRYRNHQVWGEVHDRNALIFGGASGHAGLFANATDVAKLMTMLLNGGMYYDLQLIDSNILDSFNKRYFGQNRRGLGWDKKDGDKQLLASSLAHDSGFGHSGFTGTMVWADPHHDMVFVFLSNRVYPNANNYKLSRYNTRTKIHTAAYMGISN